MTPVSALEASASSDRALRIEWIFKFLPDVSDCVGLGSFDILCRLGNRPDEGIGSFFLSYQPPP